MYHFYLAWKNPDSTATVTYDGIEVKAFALVDIGPAWTTDAALTADPPVVDVFVLPNDIANTAANNADGTAPNYFDIHPGSEFASGDSVTDKGQSGREDVTLDSSITAGTTDICVEKWQLSKTAVACVEM